MLFSGTTENRALANATVSRLKAEARIDSTRASLFWVGGYSIFAVCLGLGCGAALLGYSSIERAQSSSNEIARILATTINDASISTKGEIRLLPDARVSLKPGATVKMEPGATVEVQATRPSF